MSDPYATLDLSVFAGYTEEVARRDAEIRAHRRETERRREEQIESEALLSWMTTYS